MRKNKGSNPMFVCLLDVYLACSSELAAFVWTRFMSFSVQLTKIDFKGHGYILDNGLHSLSLTRES